ncbi:MAG: ABC transporter substrate-binding protein [Anaerolineae bacterium]|nr:ABC transporter substrate-binding protein [Anaerolineae bacterium]
MGTPPTRVISLVPSVTESLFELGLGERVIGVTDYCVHPEDATRHLPRLGGTKNPDIERILALQPDLVIANQEENRRVDVERMQAAGIPVWVTFPCTVQEALNLLWQIMEVFDDARMVPRVRLIEQTVDVTERVEMARTEPCRIFVPIWYEPLMTFNSGTFAHDLLRVCGGTNIFADCKRNSPMALDLGNEDTGALEESLTTQRDTRYPRITWADVEAAQPDVILLPSEPFAFSQEHLALFEALKVPAARAGRIHLIDGSLLTWHGTRIARALATLPSLMCVAEEAQDE